MGCVGFGCYRQSLKSKAECQTVSKTEEVSREMVLMSSLKPLSHLDVLASLCRRMKNLANMLAHIEYVMGKFCIF